MTETKKTYRFILSGGGTGGHVYPAIAIANELRTIFPGCDILFIGALGKMEMNKVPEAGYKIIGLWISGLVRKLTLKNLLFPIKLISSLVKAVGIIKNFKPDFIIGTGGYASGPTVMAANLKGIPVILQEQNSYPGITNRQLSRRAKKVCVAYPGMEKYFEPSKVVFTGNPVRSDISSSTLNREEAAKYFELDTEKPTLMVMGGSLGARTINRSVLAGWDLLSKGEANVIWQTGSFYFEDIKKELNDIPNWLHVTMFISRMDLAYALSDVVISRAGALSISELCLAGKPTIFVPSPNVAENHQEKNASTLVDEDAGVMILDRDAEKILIRDGINLLNDKSRQKTLSENILKLARPNAAKEIVNQIKIALN